MSWKFWNRRQDMPSPDHPAWERALIGRMAGDYLRDQRARRRWGIFFKFLIFFYLVAVLVVAYAPDLSARLDLDFTEEHTALIDVKGIISSETEASADHVIAALQKAFASDQVRGVILRINSPGGSPVQAGYINDEIERLKAKYKKEQRRELPVYAVAADLCASGGYYIAVGTDGIYVDKASLVGSIGVRIDGFGFQDAMQQLGIERRLLTAGDNKGILDPFLPLPESQRLFIQGVLDTLHRQFIAEVKAGRGTKLKGGDELFSGLFWSGQEAVELGLADGLGNANYVAREIIGAETIKDYTEKPDLFDSVAKRLGANFGMGALERLGLLLGSFAPH